ncbi:hypothetical protein FJZ27_01095 [Candidatus Peribacteria bacterium]|nr:hypothetical protein [Candidatus Peribacteria bacterium]
MAVTSPAKIAANKSNAKRGGVKTERGKSVVRWNAKKHGILGVLRTTYEDNVYDGYLRQLYEEHQPIGFIERLLVERIRNHHREHGHLGKRYAEVIRIFDPSFEYGRKHAWQNEASYAVLS